MSNRYEVPAEEWTKVTDDNWKDFFVSYLAKANAFCSFSFKRKWRKVTTSRKKALFMLFRCWGYCTFKDCPIKFDISVQDIVTSKVLITVKFNNVNICHHVEERQSRQIQGSTRQKMKHDLKHQSPSTIHMKLFTTLSEDELNSGKRDKVGKSPYVLQKISSEENKDRETHFDLLTSIVKLKEEADEIDTLKNKMIPGYIQRVHAYPLGVVCFTEEGIRMLHKLAKTHTIFFDATGTIVSLKKTSKLYEKATILYYSLVIQHPKKNQSPVALAEFLSTEHTVLGISFFLETVRHYQYLLYGSKTVIPAKVVIDRSRTLFLSILKAFYGETQFQYYHRCYRVVTCNGTDDDYKGFVFACISHVMKSFKNDIKLKW